MRKNRISPASILVIVGPTASGKTSLAVSVAEKLGTEILSADSMQVYRGMDIGTGKPTWAERERVLHHLIDVADPTKPFSVAEYFDRAASVVRRFQEENRPLVVCGGTGLYLMALIDGLTQAPPPDFELRARLEGQAQDEGTGVLYHELIRVDPEAASKIHVNDRKRIIRALEIYYSSGLSKSQHERRQEPPPWKENAVWIGIEREWEDLERRIHQRVEEMFDQGLVGEVKKLIETGCRRSHTSMQALGYKEVFDYLEGDRTLDRTVELIKRRTCRFARRQISWFRPNQRITWFSVAPDQDSATLTDRVLDLFDPSADRRFGN